MVKIKWNYRGFVSESYVETTEVIVGRRAGAFRPQVALNVDLQVEVKHALIWKENDQWWVQDLGTPGGTFLDGQRITAVTAYDPSQSLRMGSTTLVVEELAGGPEAPAPDEAGAVRGVPAGTQGVARVDGHEAFITTTVNARERNPIYFDTAQGDAQARLARLYEIPLELAGARDTKSLCRAVLACLTQLIPAARRGAFMVLEKETQKLALRAGLPEENPPISRTLLRRAVTEGRAFIWNLGGGQDLTQSIRAHSISSGMYCPLFWQNDVVGVVCVDNPEAIDAFTDEDLRLFMAVSHYAAAAVAGHLMKQDLREYATVLERLMTNFSPKLRGKLVARARHSALAPGGEKSQITLLMSDLRGFTRVAADLSVEQVVSMLNEYFTALVRVIFEHDGTVDKFIGDAILAVFGSPEADEHQQTKAVRAAVAMQAAMLRVNAARRARGEVCCELGIGLHYGEVLHGFIGSAERLEFTVIGDAVNRTSRYCAGAKGGEILLSAALHEFVRGLFPTVAVSVPTKHEGDFEAFRILPSGVAGAVAAPAREELPEQTAEASPAPLPVPARRPDV